MGDGDLGNKLFNPTLPWPFQIERFGQEEVKEKEEFVIKKGKGEKIGDIKNGEDTCFGPTHPPSGSSL